MHDYQLEKTTKVKNGYGDKWHVSLYKCEKCGKFKKIKSH